MHPREALIRTTAARLESKAQRAAAFPYVRSLVQSGEIVFPRLPEFGPLQELKPGQRWVTSKERRILKTKGNAGIRMNDLVFVSKRELAHIVKNLPELFKWVRTIHYRDDLWWEPIDKPVEARPATVRENWNAARSLALMEQRVDVTEDNTLTIEEAREIHPDMSDEELKENYGDELVEDDSETEDTIKPREAMLREELVAEIEEIRTVTGEDYFTDTRYPVLESQASFMVHGSNIDLDDLYGEEPRDTRGGSAQRLEKSRQWRASRLEEQFAEDPDFCMPSGIDQIVDYFGEMNPLSEKLRTCEFTGKVLSGMFIRRADYFNQRDRLMVTLAADMSEKPCKKAAPHSIPWSNLSPHPRVNDAAPERPALKKGQRWIVLARTFDANGQLITVPSSPLAL